MIPNDMNMTAFMNKILTMKMNMKRTIPIT